MALLELPNGDWIRHDFVVAVSVVTHNRAAGPVVHVEDLTGRVRVLQFDDPEAARGWARSFAELCNMQVTPAKASVDIAAAQKELRKRNEP